MLVDTDTLGTLPDRELASGLAEVIKYGLIRDAEFFEWQEKNMEKLLARYAVLIERTLVKHLNKLKLLLKCETERTFCNK